jgi:hypothetical protein
MTDRATRLKVLRMSMGRSDDVNKGRQKNPRHKRNMLAPPNFNYDYRNKKGKPTTRELF